MNKPITFQASDLIATSDSDNLEKPAYMNKPWNLKELEKLRAPQIMGFLHGEEKTVFSQHSSDKLLNIGNLQIKAPGSLDYQLLPELSHFQALIQKIAAYENKLNTSVLNYYAYLSISQKEVKAVEKENNNAKLSLELCDYENQVAGVEVSHSYLVYDKAPPLFVRQKFMVGYNWRTEKHDYIKGFERQADNENQIYCDPYSILLVSPYEPYTAGISYMAGMRTELRVLYSLTPRSQEKPQKSNLPAPPDITQDDIAAAIILEKMEKEKNKPAKKKKVAVEKIDFMDESE